MSTAATNTASPSTSAPSSAGSNHPSTAPTSSSPYPHNFQDHAKPVIPTAPAASNKHHYHQYHHFQHPQHHHNPSYVNEGEYYNEGVNGYTEDTQANHGDHNELVWMFVEQYYTTFNTDPNIIHRFYKKISTASHGVEGEASKLKAGQSEIRKLFASYDFTNCKVMITSIDYHLLGESMLMVQVIGELSNNDEPAKKFVQSFILSGNSETGDGYFILNDILRFLKDDEDILPAAEEPAATAEPEAPEVEVASAVELTEVTAESADVAEDSTTEVSTKEVEPIEKEIEEKVEPVVETTEKKTEEPVLENLIDISDESPAVPDQQPAPVPLEPEVATKVEEPVTESVQDQASEEEAQPQPVETREQPEPATATPTGPASSTPTGPSKSYAFVASAAPSQTPTEAKFTKPAPKPKAPSKPVKSSTSTNTNEDNNRNNNANNNKKGTILYHSVFLKHIDGIPEAEIRKALQAFGEITHFQLRDDKISAYLDFATAEGMEAALKKRHVPVSNFANILVDQRMRNKKNGNANGSANGYYDNTNGFKPGNRKSHQKKGGFNNRNGEKN